MADFVRSSDREIALEAGLEPTMAILDVARIMIEQGHSLLGNPLDGELDHDPDSEYKHPMV